MNFHYHKSGTTHKIYNAKTNEFLAWAYDGSMIANNNQTVWNFHPGLKNNPELRLSLIAYIEGLFSNNLFFYGIPAEFQG